jgi:hypothetical protein
MTPSNSYIETVIERAWSYLNRSTSEGEITDDYVFRHFILPAQEEVVSRCAASSTAGYVGTLNIVAASGSTLFELPPCVGSVLRLVSLDAAGNDAVDWQPRSLLAPSGPGWRLANNAIVFDPALDRDYTFNLRYTVTGDFVAHYAPLATGCTVSADGLTVTLGTPTQGYVDRRPNSLIGQMFRLLPATGIIQERIIVAHNATTGTLTLGAPLVGTSVSPTKYPYEVSPPVTQAFMQAVACRAALGMGTRARLPEGQLELIRRTYADAIKTVRDRLSTMQGRLPPSFDRNTVDNEDVRIAINSIWRL